MTRAELLAFLRAPRVGVHATVSAAGAAQAAVVGIAVTDAFEIVFDSVESTRKVQNLRRNPKVAFVIGGGAPGDDRTVQLDGIADEPTGAELERLKAAYYAAYPDGPSRLAWPGLVYIRVRPTWLRHSDFTKDPAVILEWDAEGLAGLR
jgi:general stress protein 26